MWRLLRHLAAPGAAVIAADRGSLSIVPLQFNTGERCRDGCAHNLGLQWRCQNPWAAECGASKASRRPGSFARPCRWGSRAAAPTAGPRHDRGPAITSPGHYRLRRPNSRTDLPVKRGRAVAVWTLFRAVHKGGRRREVVSAMSSAAPPPPPACGSRAANAGAAEADDDARAAGWSPSPFKPKSVRQSRARLQTPGQVG